MQDLIKPDILYESVQVFHKIHACLLNLSCDQTTLLSINDLTYVWWIKNANCNLPNIKNSSKKKKKHTNFFLFIYKSRSCNCYIVSFTIFIIYQWSTKLIQYLTMRYHEKCYKYIYIYIYMHTNTWFQKLINGNIYKLFRSFLTNSYSTHLYGNHTPFSFYFNNLLICYKGYIQKMHNTC